MQPKGLFLQRHMDIDMDTCSETRNVIEYEQFTSVSLYGKL